MHKKERKKATEGFPSNKEKSNVIVFGGSAIDIVSKITDKEAMDNYLSNAGLITKDFGGVGRNIAENLSRLGEIPVFVTVISRDSWGKEIIANLQSLGIGTGAVHMTTN